MFKILPLRCILLVGAMLTTTGVRGATDPSRPWVSPFPPGWSAVPRNCTNIRTARHVDLVVTPKKISVRPGAVASVQPTFANFGRHPFTFLQRRPPGMTFIVTAWTARTDKKVPWTRLGKYREYAWSGPTISPEVFPGHSLGYWERVNVAQYVDLSLPGKYHVLLATGKLRSNVVAVTVLPPQRVPPSSPVLGLASPPLPNWPGAGKGLRIYLEPVTSSPVPEMEAFIRDAGRHPVKIRLSGDPSRDFGQMQETGPDQPDSFTLVRHIKPGQRGKPYTFPSAGPRPPGMQGKWYLVSYRNREPVPATAYSRWLSKHPAKGLAWKTYTLRPSVIYKYAVPVNMACRFYMSMSGVYRVRVELSHTRIWSPWAKVTVPQY